MHTSMPRQRDEDGNIILTILVIFVATALAVAVMALAQSGLATSRRSGDTANALQIADAGVNDAVKQLTNYTGPLTGTPPAWYTGPGNLMPVIERSLGSEGDKYTVVAAKLEPANPNSVWHITSLGVDAQGARRLVEADGTPLSIFSSAVFGKTNLSFGAGMAVDSYSGGASAAATCNGKGFVGTNNPSSIDLNVQGGGNGVRNCTGQSGYPTPRPNNGAGWVFDGCVGYANQEPVPAFQNETTNNSCGQIRKEVPILPLDDVATQNTATDWTCDQNTAALTAGTYYFRDVTLNNGCKPVPQNYGCFGSPFTSSCLAAGASSVTPWNPVKIIASGAVKIGGQQPGQINVPPAGCPNTDPDLAKKDYYQGTTESPLSYYCRMWPGSFQVEGGAGPQSIQFGNTSFWGTVYAPARVLEGGSPQAMIWGAVLGSSVDSHAQLTVHYDESLAGLTSGRYAISNWREEPVPA